MYTSVWAPLAIAATNVPSCNSASYRWTCTAKCKIQIRRWISNPNLYSEFGCSFGPGARQCGTCSYCLGKGRSGVMFGARGPASAATEYDMIRECKHRVGVRRGTSTHMCVLGSKEWGRGFSTHIRPGVKKTFFKNSHASAWPELYAAHVHVRHPEIGTNNNKGFDFRPPSPGGRGRENKKVSYPYR